MSHVVSSIKSCNYVSIVEICLATLFYLLFCCFAFRTVVLESVFRILFSTLSHVIWAQYHDSCTSLNHVSIVISLGLLFYLRFQLISISLLCRLRSQFDLVISIYFDYLVLRPVSFCLKLIVLFMVFRSSSLRLALKFVCVLLSYFYVLSPHCFWIMVSF